MGKNRKRIMSPTPANRVIAYGVYEDVKNLIWYLSEDVINFKEIIDPNENSWCEITNEKVYDIRVKLYGEPIPTKCSYLRHTDFTDNHPNPMQALYDLRDKVFKKPSYMRYMINMFISYNQGSYVWNGEEWDDESDQYQIPPFSYCYIDSAINKLI